MSIERLKEMLKRHEAVMAKTGLVNIKAEEKKRKRLKRKKRKKK
jgi:hypothetical protein